MSSPHRSRPRTRIVSWFEDEIAELRWVCGPIFMIQSFRIAKIASPCEHGPARRDGASSDAVRLQIFSDSEIEWLHETPNYPAASRSHGRARERTRRHPRLHARVTLADAQRNRCSRPIARGDCAPLPAHARGAGLRHAGGTQFPAAAESARARRRLSRIDEHRDADQNLPGG